MAFIELLSSNGLRIANLIFGWFFGVLQLLFLAKRYFQIRHCAKSDGKYSVLKFSGLGIILFGILICIMIIYGNSGFWYGGDMRIRQCDIGMKWSMVLYSSQRFSVYMFLIYRVNLVNVLSSSARFIILVKRLLMIFYICTVVSALIFTKGNLVDGEVNSCRGKFRPEIQFVAAVMDLVICFIALKWFLRPLKQITQQLEIGCTGSKDVLQFLEKMRIYGYIMIISSFLAMFLSAIFGGLSLVIAVDAGITSFALVSIYEPRETTVNNSTLSLNVISTSDLNSLVQTIAGTSKLNKHPEEISMQPRKSLGTMRIFKLLETELGLQSETERTERNFSEDKLLEQPSEQLILDFQSENVNEKLRLESLEK